MTEASRFEPAAGRWLAGLSKLRNAVRQHVVTAQLLEVLGREAPRRVLDIGCGQGTQAIALARAGHDLTGLDSSAELLQACRSALEEEPEDVRDRVQLVHGRGEDAAELVQPGFDAVLCHGVLMYADDDLPLLRAATQVSRPGAVLSLLVRNGHALALRPGLLRDWDGATAAVGSASYLNRIGVDARAHRVEELTDELEGLGWDLQRWFGVRVLTDHLDEAAPPDEELQRIVAAELAVGAEDPYRRVAALLHCLFARR